MLKKKWLNRGWASRRLGADRREGLFSTLGVLLAGTLLAWYLPQVLTPLTPQQKSDREWEAYQNETHKAELRRIRGETGHETETAPPVWPLIVSAALGALCLPVLLVRRRRPAPRLFITPPR